MPEQLREGIKTLGDVRYSLELFYGRNYREQEVGMDSPSEVVIGTTKNCLVRLPSEHFFSDFEILLIRGENGEWSIFGGDNNYLSDGNMLKLRTLSLTHGSAFSVYYQDGDVEICHGTFLRSFGAGNQNYSSYIDLTGITQIEIGGNSECQILIRDEAVGKDSITFGKNGQNWQITDHRSRYGIAVNGSRIEEKAILSNYDFFSMAGHGFFLKEERLYICNDPMIQVIGLRVLEHSDSKSSMQYPHLNKSTRMYYQIPTDEIEYIDPPEKIKEKKQNLFLMLLPSAATLILMVFLRGALGGGGAFIVISAGSMAIGIVTSIITYRMQKKESKEGEENRILTYTEYAKKKEEEIINIRNEETMLMEMNTPALGNTIQSVMDFDERIFERSKDDKDFLAVRIGTGSVKSMRQIKYGKKERLTIDDEMVMWPEVISKKYEFLPNAPILLPLNKLSMIGILGNGPQVYEHLKMIIVDLCVRHSYQDLQMGIIFPNKDYAKWEWVRWLPHFNNEDTGLRNIVYDEDSFKVFAENMYNIFSKRESGEKKRGNQSNLPHYVIIITEAYEIMTHPISRFFENGEAIGVSFIFCNGAKELLPNCQKMLLLGNEMNQLVDSEDAGKKDNYVSFSIQDSLAKRIAKKMACVTVDEVSLESRLTKSITLFRLLGIYKADDLDLKNRWKESKVFKSMSVPMGVDAKNDIVYLDLHEKAHGPHGLVAGTTGSGKSEILQTYILSIATYFHPYEVSFLIIDFKGGGMVNQFRELPHLLGAITNIDGKEINRSLKSIKAELQKRQRLFAEADVNHIDLYIKKYKAGEVEIPLPHLIIIVDEFAELKAEQPDFMKELISTARIGRSLGVHLILATQKPAGQVDNQIWSNSRFKLCLKVQGVEDSNEVLKSPLAAEIKEPGRAYLQVGNNEIFELFQSAYSGASERVFDNTGSAVSIVQVELSGRKTELYREKKNENTDVGRTQLEAIVEHVDDYCRQEKIERLSSICLPSLEKVIEYSGNKTKSELEFVDIGIYDDPENQYQGSTFVDICNKNTLIIGSSQYGKTNLLQLIIREIATQYSSKEAHIYILDFASMFLKNFETLKHVGGVVCTSDDEKFKNLMKLLSEEISTRREKLVNAGVSSFLAYREAGFDDLPHIFIFVDNMTALFELYLNEDDSFLEIVREGIAVGITCIVANSQTSGFGYKYLSNFSNRIMLYCNDSGEYSNLFSRPETKPDEVVGRAILEVEKRILECQTYLAFPGEKEIDRSNNVKAFIAQINEENMTIARKIPYIPALLTKEMLSDGFRAETIGYSVPVGLSYLSVEPFYLNFSRIPMLGVCGKSGRGHFNFISNIFDSFEKNANQSLVRAWILDGVDRKYKDLQKLSITELYTINPESIKGVIENIYEILSKRYEEMFKENKTQNSLLLLIINNNDAARVISNDRELMDKYRTIMDKYKNLNISIIFTDYQNQALPYDAPEPMQMIKREKKVLYLDELSNLKVIDVPYGYVKEFKRKMQQGDAFLINDNLVEKIKMVKSAF